MPRPHNLTMDKPQARGQTVPTRILVVDDDAADAQALCALLTDAGHEVETAASTEEALAKFREGTYAIVVADVQLPGESGLDLVRQLRDQAPATAVVVMTGHASVSTAITALKLGAVDYLKKPVHVAQLKKLIAQLAAERPAFLPNALLNPENQGEEVFEGMLARSSVMHRVFESITAVAQTDATVLIVGETGTGKELVSRAVHNRSGRANGPFIPVHTGAIPKDLIESELFGHEKGAFTGAVTAAEGKFGAAKGGTIFLDEVSTMSDRAQVDLLRVLETFRYTRVGGKVEHSADVRVVCATNRDLLAMAQDGKFREDLYYRINIFPISLPPLRQRLEDIGLLADRFMRAAAERYKKAARVLPESSVELLMSYAWPGNVRELRNLVEQAVLLEKGERLEPELINRLLMERPTRTTFSSQLGTPPSPASRLDQTPVAPLPLPTPVIPIAVGTRVEDAERQLALRTLEAYAGDRIAACAALGVDSARLDEILGGHAAQHAVPHN
jgi:DNA-binding NtrC family response regulator